MESVGDIFSVLFARNRSYLYNLFNAGKTGDTFPSILLS